MHYRRPIFGRHDFRSWKGPSYAIMQAGEGEGQLSQDGEYLFFRDEH